MSIEEIKHTVERAIPIYKNKVHNVLSHIKKTPKKYELSLYSLKQHQKYIKVNVSH